MCVCLRSLHLCLGTWGSSAPARHSISECVSALLLCRDLPNLRATFGCWQALARHSRRSDLRVPALFAGLQSYDISSCIHGRPDAYTPWLDIVANGNGAAENSLQADVPQVVPWTHSQQQQVTDRLREVQGMWLHAQATGGLPGKSSGLQLALLGCANANNVNAAVQPCTLQIPAAPKPMQQL